MANLTYRWQVSTNGGSSWGNSGAAGYATAGIQLELTETRIGQMYRCKITDSYGNVVYSDPCSINFASDTWEFTYNADGLRTSRTDGYTTYNYVYHGGQLSQMTVGDQVLRFGYDANGMPLYVIWNASKYFYTTNLQGDVVAIVSANGNPVVEYTYDAWGNILSVTGSSADNLGKYNPLRYRGYVYDIETELYYLQSRYYNPEWGRFLNADGYVSTGQGLLGNNMFAYCLNNPVNHVDKDGKQPDTISGWIGEQVGELLYKWFTGNDHPNDQTEVLESQIVSEQNKMIADFSETMWDAYVHSNELQVELQHQQNTMVRESVGQLIDATIEDPLVAVDAAAGFTGTALSYIGYATAVAGIAVPVVGQIAMGILGTACGIWGIYRLFE